MNAYLAIVLLCVGALIACLATVTLDALRGRSPPNENYSAKLDKLAELALWTNDAIGQLTAAVTAAQQREVIDMATMQEAIKKLQDDVTAETTVIDSAVTLLNQIPDLIRNAAGDPAALEQLAATIEANSAGLAAAVTANTPAA